MNPKRRNTIDDATHDEWVAASQTMKKEITKEWCEKSAKIEGDAAVGAGLPSALGLPKIAAPSGALALATCSAARKNFLTPEQCAQQFEMYAATHRSADSQHSLRFCAEFLREFCIQPNI